MTENMDIKDGGTGAVTMPDAIRSAHAEGFAQGYAAAKAQAVGVARTKQMSGRDGTIPTRFHHVNAQARAIAQAIATMEPGA